MRKKKKLTNEQIIERANKRCNVLFPVAIISFVIFIISYLIKNISHNEIAETIYWLSGIVFGPSIYMWKYYDTVLHQDLLRREQEKRFTH